MKPLISRRTLNELREYFVGTTLRVIDDEFTAAGVEPDTEYEPPVSGMRRTLVEQYYRTLDLTKWDDARKLLDIFESILNQLRHDGKHESYEPARKSAIATFDSLVGWLERDGFEYESGRLESTGPSAQVREVQNVAVSLALPEVLRQIERIRSAVDEDPALAIGTAKELLETVCKTILDDRKVPYQDSDDVPKLVKETRRALKLLPDSIPSNAKGAETIRRLLASLATIGQGMAELRNLYGTGHGRSGKAKGVNPRHARLAVGAATTLAVFLLETNLERSS